MHNQEQQDLFELLAQVAAIKTRLTQISAARQVSAGSPEPGEHVPSSAALDRTRKHLELAMETLGAPAWGFMPTASSSLKITGFHAPDIYKALKDIRSRTRGDAKSPEAGDEAKGSTDSASAGALDRRSRSANGRRKADRISQPWAAAAKRRKKSKGAPKRRDQAPQEQDQQEEQKDPVPLPSAPLIEPVAEVTQPAIEAEAAGDDSSVWVQHRVDEIQRALTAAFGDDDFLGGGEVTPKPFAAPEFIGNTDALSVPELVGFFQLQGKTGVLTIDARQEQFTLEYLRGELIHAGSSSSPDGQRLGEVLVKLGHLTQSKLERLLAGKSNAERLGDALRRGEVVGEEALAEALQYQIQNIFYRLFDLGGCRFTFREGLEGEPCARVRYNVTRLLLETARHRDELEGESERRAG